MKMPISYVLSALLLISALPAKADARLDGLKKMNSEGCVQSIQFEKIAPKDPKQVPQYCNCVYSNYYDSFSKAEQEQIVSAAELPEKLSKSLPQRLETAQLQCRKKIGF